MAIIEYVTVVSRNWQSEQSIYEAEVSSVPSVTNLDAAPKLTENWHKVISISMLLVIGIFRREVI